MTTEKIKQICEKGFATHKATLIQNTDRYLIIDWRRADGSGEYYVNYIVDKKRGSLIVSGDLGDSIATWYNHINPSDLKDWVKNDIGYYISKVQCSSPLYYYESDNIVADIKEKLKDIDVDDLISTYNEYNYCCVRTEEELWDRLDGDVSTCIYTESFIPAKGTKDFCEELDSDYWEWIYDCGKRIHPRVYLWADGFYRAYKQIEGVI